MQIRFGQQPKPPSLRWILQPNWIKLAGRSTDGPETGTDSWNRAYSVQDFQRTRSLSVGVVEQGEISGRKIT